MRNLVQEIENNILDYGYNTADNNCRKLEINELSDRMEIDVYSLKVICEALFYVNSDYDGNTCVSCYIES